MKYFALPTLILIILLLPSDAKSQVVALNPPFAAQTDNVVITFDASKGNAALTSQNTVYAHTGVITNLSSSPTAWRYVQGNWGTDDSKVKMTAIGNNKFTLSININQFYGVPSNETVQKLAFVFRNQDGSVVGREADGGDIFVSIGSGTFQANLTTNPSGTPAIAGLSDSIEVIVNASAKANLQLFINNNLLVNVNDTPSLQYKFSASTLGNGKHQIKLIAQQSNNTVTKLQDIIIRSNNASNVAVSPPGIADGINYINDSTVILQLFAPQKSYVYVIGDFNNWELNPAYEMNKTPDGNRFWIQLNQLTPGVEYAYQYSIGKELLRIADYYADKLLDQNNDPFIPSITYPNLKPYPVGKTNNYVSVLQTAQTAFNWQHTQSFVKPPKNKLVIYELLVRDFIGRHDYLTLIDTLSYLQRLGVNAIELMPINEFEGNESWGYNPSFYFAPDKYYGTKDALKMFIDECHKRGIAVILDVVLNHSFGQSSMVRMYWDAANNKPAANSPWFNPDATHPFNVGYDFNHESIYTQAFVDTVLKYWIHEYKIDGYRFDLSKGFTQTNSGSNVGQWSAYDQSRINLWKRIYDKVKPNCTDCYYILEHFADNSEETVLANYGFLFWGNTNAQFNEATMAYSSNLSGASYKSRNWTTPQLVAFAESHDEERLMYKNIMFGSTANNHNTKDTSVALSRMEAAIAMLAPLPGPYMIWQFGELGYDYSINFNGRIGNKPIRWDYLNNSRRKRLYDVYAAFNHLKTTYPVFTTTNFSYNLTSAIKTINLNDSSMNVVVAANFNTIANNANLTLAHSGWWYNYFSGDSVNYSGTSASVNLLPGAYVVLTDKKLPTPFITPIVNGINNPESTWQIGLFPNPAQQHLEVHTAIPLEQYSITDLSGKILQQGKLISGEKIDISSISPGFYFMVFEYKQQFITKKFIINK